MQEQQDQAPQAYSNAFLRSPSRSPPERRPTQPVPPHNLTLPRLPQPIEVPYPRHLSLHPPKSFVIPRTLSPQFGFCQSILYPSSSTIPNLALSVQSTGGMSLDALTQPLIVQHGAQAPLMSSRLNPRFEQSLEVIDRWESEPMKNGTHELPNYEVALTGPEDRGRDHAGAQVQPVPPEPPQAFFGGFINTGRLCSGYAQGRWQTQESLAFLQIRSELDYQFKEAPNKSLLWQEVSRIMAERYGYQRSGKECKDKFYNMSKYYNRTKKGREGRQDGKRYRFSGQIEALHSASSSNLSNKVQHNHEDLCQGDDKSLPVSSDYCTSSSDGDLCNAGFEENTAQKRRKAKCKSKRRKGSISWFKELMDIQFRRYMDLQKTWFERMLESLEDKKQQRMEEWHRQRAKTKAWIEARDSILMGAIQKINEGEKISCAEIMAKLSNLEGNFD